MRSYYRQLLLEQKFISKSGHNSNETLVFRAMMEAIKVAQTCTEFRSWTFSHKLGNTTIWNPEETENHGIMVQLQLKLHQELTQCATKNVENCSFCSNAPKPRYPKDIWRSYQSIPQRHSWRFWRVDTIWKWNLDDRATSLKMNGSAQTATLWKVSITHNLSPFCECPPMWGTEWRSVKSLQWKVPNSGRHTQRHMHPSRKLEKGPPSVDSARSAHPYSD